ncbi:unnamed protein product [Protopolystoma xenopodis]|uniref:Uncharacterized protein n=1 Tax=Protopolystoma xenopodis TaxID=117903 RepID=A0A448WAY6_9PLAT|nr:unnamed protein product [Protopolystoma xenopodis]
MSTEPENAEPSDAKPTLVAETSSSGPSREASWDNLPAMTPEYFNLALAFFIFLLRYPSVFWYTNRPFAFLFSFLLLLASLQALTEFSAAGVLVKLAWNHHLLADSTAASGANLAAVLSGPNGRWRQQVSSITGGVNGNARFKTNSVGREVDPTGFSLLEPGLEPEAVELANFSALLLSSFGSLVMFGLFVGVFEYGYSQFLMGVSSYKTNYFAGHDAVQGSIDPGAATASGFVDAVERSASSPGLAGMLAGGLDSEVVGPGFRGTTGLGLSLGVGSNGAEAGSAGSAGGLSTRPGVSRLCGQSTHKRYGLRRLKTASCTLYGIESLGAWCSNLGLLFLTVGLATLAMLSLKVPVAWTCLRVYWASRNGLMLASLLVSATFAVAWATSWFAFGLKPTWRFKLIVAPLPDDAGEMFGNVPSQWSDAGNQEYYGRGLITRHVPQGLAGIPSKLRKRGQINIIKLK